MLEGFGLPVAPWHGMAIFEAESYEKIMAIFQDEEYMRVVIPDESKVRQINLLYMYARRRDVLERLLTTCIYVLVHGSRKRPDVPGRSGDVRWQVGVCL